MSESTVQKRSFFANTSIYMFSTLISFAIPILTLPIYTRYLSPADFGVIILFTMFGNLLCGFISLNLHFSTYRYYFKFNKDIGIFKTLNSTNLLALLLLFTVSGLLLSVSSEWISTALFDNQLTKQLILLSFLSGCFGYFILYFTTLLTVQILAISATIMTISLVVLDTSLTLFFIFKYSLTYMARIYAIIISQGIIVVILFLITRKLFVFRFSTLLLKKSIKLAYPLIPNSLVGIIQDSFDKTMLNKFTGITSVGYYAFGGKFAIAVKFVSDAVDKVFNPFFLEKAHENTIAAKFEITNLFYKIAFFVLFIGVCIIYFSEELIIVLTTKEFYPSMYVAPVYVWYYLIGVMSKISMNQVTYSEKMGYVLPGTIAMVIVNVILNLIFIPKYGAVGAAGATAISAIFSQLTLFYFGMKLYPLPIKIKKIALLYSIVFVMTLLVYPIMALEISFFLKIGIKISIIIIFIISGIHFNFISKSDILTLLNRVKITKSKI